jgi:hypothetical protein
VARYSSQTKQAVLDAVDQGLSYQEIMHVCGIASRRTIRRFVREHVRSHLLPELITVRGYCDAKLLLRVASPHIQAHLCTCGRFTRTHIRCYHAYTQRYLCIASLVELEEVIVMWSS